VKRGWAVLMLILAAGSGYAIESGKAFDDPVMQMRYDKIISEVRCLVCQNQAIKDSNAILANDLRREIRRMLIEDKTDEEVFNFLVVRYGDFVLYRPRMGGKTLILWIMPFLLIGAGGLVAFKVIRGCMKILIDDDSDSDQRTG
jgi:cytochrome c-type biogenesis protein CcmH